ncbi:hypothetical protein ABBQ38_009587 [Trebouxia sp. C0009 RCD-2024]
MHAFFRALAYSVLLVHVAVADPVSFDGTRFSSVGRNTDGNGLPSGIEAAVGNNPYSEVVIPVAGGDWQVGDVLVGNWNDPTNTLFGQGNTLTLVRGAAVVTTYTYPQGGQCDPKIINTFYNGSGYGFTMAAAWLGNGYVLQCSLPISTGTEPNAIGPGCCIAINNRGKIVAQFANDAINGPWGATSVVDNSNPSANTTLFISNVLGVGQSLTPNGGTIQRYSFQVPTSDSGWQSSRFAGRLGGGGSTSPGSPGTLGHPTQIFPTGSHTGFHSTPANITGGSVGPAGLAYSPVTDTLYAMGTVSNPAPQGSMYKIPNPIQCQGTACMRSTFVRCSPNLGGLAQGKCSGCNGPIGAVFYSGAKGNFIVQANGQDGCINQYSENGQLVSSLFVDGTVDAAGNNPGQGNLFNLAFTNINPTPSMLVVDDAANAVFLNPLNVPAGTSPPDTPAAAGRKLMM